MRFALTVPDLDLKLHFHSNRLVGVAAQHTREDSPPHNAQTAWWSDFWTTGIEILGFDSFYTTLKGVWWWCALRTECLESSEFSDAPRVVIRHLHKELLLLRPADVCKHLNRILIAIERCWGRFLWCSAACNLDKYIVFFFFKRLHESAYFFYPWVDNFKPALAFSRRAGIREKQCSETIISTWRIWTKKDKSNQRARNSIGI